MTDIQPHRQYVEGDFASHLIGYIGEIQARQLEQGEYADYRPGEIVGQTGIENLLEAELRGSKGGRSLVVDVAGRHCRYRDGKSRQTAGITIIAGWLYILADHYGLEA